MVNKNLKRTEAGIIPADWDVATLAEIFVSLEAGVSVNSDERCHSNTYVLKSSAVSEGSFLPQEVKAVVPKDIKRVKCPVVGGSIIISRMNTPQLVGESGYVAEDKKDTFLPDRLWQAQNFKPDEYDFRWLNYVLSYGRYREEVRSSGTGTSNSMKNISKESFLRVAIPKPSITEQKTIATALEDVDKLIITVRKELEKLQGLKLAHLYEMFPHGTDTVPKTRLKGFSVSWNRSSIGACLGERHERSSQGQLLSVTMNDGIKRFRDVGRRDNSSSDKSNYKKVEVGDIVYNSMRMWQGASGYSSYDGIVSPAYTVLYPREGMCSKFFAYAFKTYDLINLFQTYSQGMTTDTWNLKYPALSEINMFVPEMEEQIMIAEHFEYIDDLIDSNRNRLEKYREIKQGMMSELLTGKTRLI